MEELLHQDRDNPLLKRELAQTAGDVGEVYEMLGDGPEAERHFAESANVYRELAVADRRSVPISPSPK